MECSSIPKIVVSCGAHHPPHNKYSGIMAQSDEEDDYMNMTFEDAPKGPKYETSLQRAARKRKEVRASTTMKTYSLTVYHRARPDQDKRPRLSAKPTPKQHGKHR